MDIYKTCKDLYLEYKDDCSRFKLKMIDKQSISKLSNKELENKLSEINYGLKYLKKCINKRIKHRINCIEKSELDETHLYWIKKLIRDYNEFTKLKLLIESKIKKEDKKDDKKELIREKQKVFNIYDVLSSPESDSVSDTISDTLSEITLSDTISDSLSESVNDSVSETENKEKDINDLLDKLILENEKNTFVKKSEIPKQKKIYFKVVIAVKHDTYRKIFKMNQEDDVKELINFIYGHLNTEKNFNINREDIKLYYNNVFDELLLNKKTVPKSIPENTLLSELKDDVVFDEILLLNDRLNFGPSMLDNFSYILPLLYKIDKNFSFYDLVKISPILKKSFVLLETLNKLNQKSKDITRNKQKINELIKEADEIFKNFKNLKFKTILNLMCNYITREQEENLSKLKNIKCKIYEE